MLQDTFRWKSENVSTTAVSEAMGAVVSEANVYGVLGKFHFSAQLHVSQSDLLFEHSYTVPTHEGRAGCAAIPTSSRFDMDQLAAHVSKVLPKYAQPLFVRIVEKMESTGTEKQLKVALRNEGVDPDKVKDPVYWLQGGKYIKFEQQHWDALKAGKVKL